MPTYEYKCNKCEEVFEVFQKITEEPLNECPVCGGELKRLISGGAGIIFKGSGFYTTDNKSSAQKTSTKSTSNKSENIKEENKKQTKEQSISRDSKKDK